MSVPDFSRNSSAVFRKSSLISSFDKDDFLKKDFEVEEFVTDAQKRVTLPLLKKELGGHLTSLKKELVDLINDDYADFVNLSATLIGTDQVIDIVKTPLVKAREDIIAVRDEFDISMEELTQKLDQRTLIIEKKTLMQAFLNISVSLAKIEEFLNISHFHHRRSSTDIMSEELENNDRQSQNILAERVVSEFNQLQFYVSQCGNLPYIQSIKPRLETVTITLLGGLNSKFENSIVNDTRDEIEQSLRTYSILGKSSDAENLFAVTIVRPFLQEVVTKEKLMSTSLNAIYDSIIVFIKEKCQLIIDITKQPGLKGFDFLLNSIWVEVSQMISKNISSIYSPGIPDKFHKNYTSTIEFVENFEMFYYHVSQVKNFRSSTTFTEFMGRFSLSIYYQLRFQEIASDFERSLILSVQPPLEPDQQDTEPMMFLLTTVNTLWHCIQRIWDNDIFLAPLAHRFWKLSLQIISRFHTWTQDILDKQDSDFQNKYCSLLLCDISQFTTQIPVLFKHMISKIDACTPTSLQQQQQQQEQQQQVVPNTPEIVSGLHQFHSQVQDKTREFLPKLQTILQDSLIEKSEGSLKTTYSVSSAFRGQTKEMPEKESDFASEILKPLKQEIEKYKQNGMPKDILDEIILYVLRKVTERYSQILQEVLVNVENTEKSLLALRKIRKNVKSGTSDEDRIRRQIYLNVEYHKKDIESFHLPLQEIPEYESIGAIAKPFQPQN